MVRACGRDRCVEAVGRPGKGCFPWRLGSKTAIVKSSTEGPAQVQCDGDMSVS